MNHSATVRFSQDRSYSLVRSFLFLPRTDSGAGGSERDGADVRTMQLPSLGGHKRKDLERRYLKANLLKCRPPSLCTSTCWILLPIEGQMENHSCTQGGALRPASLKSRTVARRKIQFIFKCHLQSVSIIPTTHNIKGKKGKV